MGGARARTGRKSAYVGLRCPGIWRRGGWAGRGWKSHPMATPSFGCILLPMGVLEALPDLRLVVRYAVGTLVIPLVDRRWGQGPMISGACKSGDATRYVRPFGRMRLRSGVNVWAGYLPPNLNIAGAPSMSCNVPRGESEITTPRRRPIRLTHPRGSYIADTLPESEIRP